MGLNLVWCKVNLANKAIMVLSLKWKQRWQALGCFQYRVRVLTGMSGVSGLKLLESTMIRVVIMVPCFRINVLYLYYFFCLFILGAYSAMLRVYFWLCTLDWFTNYMGCQKSNLRRQHARQLPYPQDYLSSPNMWHF